MENSNQVTIGWGSADITPGKASLLRGQHYSRVSEYIETPITATALNFRSKKLQVLMLSCDLLCVYPEIEEAVKLKIQNRLHGFDCENFFMNATHTHTAPSIVPGLYLEPYDKSNFITVPEYLDFLSSRCADAAIEAYESNKKAYFCRGTGFATLGHNRRAVFSDGTARMCTDFTDKGFRFFEAGEDPAIEIVFFCDEKKQAKGAIVNLACPAQVSSLESFISADFWHEIRVEVRGFFGEDFFIFPQCAASGDQCPGYPATKKTEDYMLKLAGRTRRQEFGKRVAEAIQRTWDIVSCDIKPLEIINYRKSRLELPFQHITKEDTEGIQQEINKLRETVYTDYRKESGRQRMLIYHKGVLERYQALKEGKAYHFDCHCLRMGDSVLITNPFELFMEYGQRIKAQNNAAQTFIVQLACDYGEYLPTARAVAGGGFSARLQDNIVGSEGGEKLVKESIEIINSLF